MTAGSAAISRRGGMSTSGRTASTFRPGWGLKPSVSWSFSGPRPKERRSSSAFRSSCARARRVGASCWSTSRPAASRCRRRSPWATGFWKALDEAFPGTRHQRCWVHKIANVLNKFPKSIPPTVKVDLREIWQAQTRAAAETAMDIFSEKYGAKYEKAVTCLTKDKEALLTFYDFPADHWDHLRTGNPIESVFATVRHRTVRTKGALSQKTAKLMVFKLVQAAAKTWRRLKGANQLPLIIEGVTFTDGVAANATENRAA